MRQNKGETAAKSAKLLATGKQCTTLSSSNEGQETSNSWAGGCRGDDKSREQGTYAKRRESGSKSCLQDFAMYKGRARRCCDGRSLQGGGTNKVEQTRREMRGARGHVNECHLLERLQSIVSLVRPRSYHWHVRERLEKRHGLDNQSPTPRRLKIVLYD